MSDKAEESKEQFCDRKMRVGMEKWDEWFRLNPDATAEEGAQDLFEMLPGEPHEAAFRRYCAGDDRRDGKRDMVFGGEV